MNSPNIWKRFQRLIPATSLIIVSVVENNGDGTSTVQNAQGQQFLVRGEGVTAGNKAFILDGEMRGEAPNLIQVDYEI